MSDSLLRKYTMTSAKGASPSLLQQIEEEAGEVADCGAFGFLRGVRDRALMLEFRRKDGNIRSLGYAWLGQVDFDPSTGITLQFGGQKVTLKGRNLNTDARAGGRLFDGICRHRVPWIQEADEAGLMQAGDRDTVVERIDW